VKGIVDLTTCPRTLPVFGQGTCRLVPLTLRWGQLRAALPYEITRSGDFKAAPHGH
jgi:hypothetical protein